MEALAQRLQDALGQKISVYLGSEHLSRQPRLPHVVVVPGSADYGPPTGQVRDALATVQVQHVCICKALTFEEALILSDACYTALALGQRAPMRLRSELWGERVIRCADLTVTHPATLTRSDVARVQVHTFTQHVEFTNPNIQEVPDGTNETGAGVRGDTDFRDRPG